MIGGRALVEGDYGEGAYGPTIMLRLRGPEGVEQLRSVFERLAGSPVGATVDLVDEPGFEFGAAIWSLRLRVEEVVREKHLKRDDEGGFIWLGSKEEWTTSAQLVEPLRHQAGHQYLTDEVEDDALVEVTHGELDD